MALFGATGNVVSRALVALDIDAHEFNRKLDEADARLAEHGNTAGKALKAGYAVAGGAAILLGVAIEKSAKTASDAQVVRAREQAQLKALSISYGAHRKEIDSNVEALRKLAGFTDEELTGSFTRLVGTTHSVSAANKDLAIAADVARGRHISLEAATQLVTKAQIGQTGALRRLGIDIQTVHTHQDALTAAHVKASPALRAQAKELDRLATAHQAVALLQARYTGQAKAYGDTTAGQFARMHAALQALEVTIGNAVLPVLARLAEWFTKIIERLQASTRAHQLARDVIDRLRSAWQAIVGVLQTVWSALQTVAGFLERHRTLLKALEVAVGAALAAYTAFAVVQRIIKAVTAAQAALNAVMAMNPIGLVIIAIAALAAGFYLLYQRSETFRKVVHVVFDELKQVVASTVNFVREHWKLLVVILTGPFGALAIFIGTHFKQVRELVSNLFDWLKRTALQVALAIVEPFSHLPGKMGKWARDAKDAINAELAKTAAGAAAAGTAAGTAYAQSFMGAAQPALSALTGGGVGSAAGGGAASGAPGSQTKGRGGMSSGVASFRQASIVTTARTQIGIPYQFGGAAQLGRHTDCIGLTQAVMRQNGISVGRTTWAQYAQGAPVSWAQLQAGDLVFFSIPEDGGTPPQHVGIYIGGGMMIHDPHTGASVTTVNLDSSYWRQHFYGARRYVKGGQSAGTGGGGASGAPGAAADTGSTGTGAGTGGTTAAQDRAFKAALGSAPSSTKAKAAPKTTFATAPQIHTVERELAKDYGQLAVLHRAGLDKLADELQPKLQRLRDELSTHLTAKGLARVRDQMAQLETRIRSGVQRATQIVQERRQAFEAAWTTFADRAMTAFDRITQAHLSKMQRDVAKAIASMRVSVNGAFSYGAGDQTPAQRALQALQDAHDAAQRQSDMDQAQTALSDAQKGGDPQAVKEAQKQVDELVYQQRVADLQKQADLEQKAADDALQAAQQAAQDAADQAQRDYEDQRQTQRDALGKQLADLENHLENRTATFAEANAVLTALMQQGGADVGSAFIAGLTEALSAAGLSLSDYTQAAGGSGTAAARKAGVSAATAARLDPAMVAALGGIRQAPTVTQTLNFPAGTPAQPAAAAARYAAGRVWAV